MNPLRLSFDEVTTVPTALNEVILRHCRVDEDVLSTDGNLINVYQLAAIQWFEKETKRAVVSRAHRLVLRAFPCSSLQELQLPRGKTQSVQSIQYVQNGQTFTLTGPTASPAGSDFQEDLYGDAGGVLMPPQGDAWPTTDLDTPSPVIVNFTAGWTESQIPEDVLYALMFYVSDAIDLRGTSDLDIIGNNLDIRNTFADKYRLRRVY